MPETEKKPLWLRKAEGLYGQTLGSNRRSVILAAMEDSWEDDELFILAHLSYLNLEAQAEIQQQNREIISLLKGLVRQGRTALSALDELGEVLADAEADDDEDDDADEEPDEAEDDFEEDKREEPAEDLTTVPPTAPPVPIEVLAPAEPARPAGGGRRKKPLAHPEPAEGGGQ